jgi:hypothetical protein
MRRILTRSDLNLYKPYSLPGKSLLFTLMLIGFLPVLSYGINNPLNLRRACKSANDSDITLKWNLPQDACNSFISYDIYARKDSFTPFSLIDSVKTYSQNQYIHKGAFLQAATWQYFVIIRFNCSGSPTLSSDTLNIDLTQPFDQLIDSVSVDPVSGKYIIGWAKNNSLDLAGYKIYSVVGGNNIEIADLDNTSTSYSDLLSDPQTGTKVYSIAAYDSCNNITAIIDKHIPIKLSVSFDSCNKSFTLNWSSYSGMNILKYRILLNINGTGFIGIKDVSSSSTTYIFSGASLSDGDQVCFIVRGFKSNDTLVSTSSNQICLNADLPDISSVNYISSVSVSDANHITVDWLTDRPDLISVIVLKQSTDGSNYITRRAFKPSSSTIHFLLDSVNTDSLVYYYKVLAYNTCGLLQGSSQLCNTILISASKINPSSNQVIWNSYNSFNAGISAYEVYHGTGDIYQGYTFSLVSSVDSSRQMFTDNLLPDSVANDGVCYYIKAVESFGNQYGVSGAESKSNQVCIPGDMLVYYPNIFRPSSLIKQNQVFKPIGVFIDFKKSKLTIFDRWGNLVFDAPDLTTGWNGTNISGEAYTDDTFIYYSIIYPIKGKPQEFKGIVHLER